jgi:hypothetical protein
MEQAKEMQRVEPGGNDNDRTPLSVQHGDEKEEEEVTRPSPKPPPRQDSKQGWSVHDIMEHLETNPVDPTLLVRPGDAEPSTKKEPIQSQRPAPRPRSPKQEKKRAGWSVHDILEQAGSQAEIVQPGDIERPTDAEVTEE